MDQRLDDAAVLQILEGTQAIRKGHFVLTSGRHSDTYVQCARILEHPSLTNRLAAEAAARLPEDMEVDLVASPAVGASCTALPLPVLWTSPSSSPSGWMGP